MSIVNGKGQDAKWENLMIDLEGLGKKPGYVITEIACVPFNWNDKNIRKEDVFYTKINLQSSINTGLKIDAETLIWWSEQDPELYKKTISPENSVSLGEGLYKLTQYIQSLYPSQLKVWGNSNRFDLGLLDACYDALNKSHPWYFRNERDVRTLVGLYPEIKENHIWTGNIHDPIDDCINQIDYCVEIKNRIKLVV